MDWLKPLQGIKFRTKRRYRRDGCPIPEPRPRAVVINGVRYDSMLEARHALGWTYRQVYFAIGEGWRYADKRRAA